MRDGAVAGYSEAPEYPKGYGHRTEEKMGCVFSVTEEASFETGVGGALGIKQCGLDVDEDHLREIRIYQR